MNRNSRHLLSNLLLRLHILKHDRCCNLRPLFHLPHMQLAWCKEQTRWDTLSDVAEAILDTWTVEWWLVDKALTWGDRFCRLPSWLHHRALWNNSLDGVSTRRFGGKFDCWAYYQWPHGETLVPHFPYLCLTPAPIIHNSTQCHSASSTTFQQA